MGLIAAGRRGVRSWTEGVRGMRLKFSVGALASCVLSACVTPGLVATALESQPVSAPGVTGIYFPAKGTTPRPAILLFGGSEGGLGEGTQRDAEIGRASCRER